MKFKKNNYNNELILKKDSLKKRIYNSTLDKELYAKKAVIFKITASAVFLSIAVGLSLLEIFDIPMPWGASFGIRFFDTLVIIYSISIVGLGFALLEGLALPWIHNAIDGKHSWIEMGFFAVSDTLVVIVVWFVYYILFNAAYKTKIPENTTNHSIHEYHFSKTNKEHGHHHKIISIKWTKKILSFIIIVPVCALIEACSNLIVAIILLSVGSHAEGTQGLNTVFSSAGHVLIYLGIFGGIFLLKYIMVSGLFLLLENRTRVLIDRFGIYS